jgi:chemotaxis protein methyltransferase CheR
MMHTAIDIEQAAIGEILSVVHARTGIDFSAYRARTLHRRILNRMVCVGLDSLERYLELVTSCELEALRLLERVTIKVSRFYRNAATFDCLRQRVIPELAKASQGKPLRVWSAGCGCGEEAWTYAMLLDEAGVPGSIEATDIDPGALARGPAGVYPESACTELPEELAARYLQPVSDGARQSYRVRDVLRQRVRFSRFDVTVPASPPAGGSFDIVSCRNVLIYLQRETHERIMRGLFQALNRGGVLCLGEAEWPPPPVLIALQTLGRNTRLFRAVGSLDPEANG